MQTSPQTASRTTVVESCVESLCEQGCVKVSGYIEALQDNRVLPELAGLSDAQRLAVLDELVSIMAVYGGQCRRTPP